MRKKTPFEILVEETPDISQMTFGSKLKVLLPKNYLDGKVSPKVWDGAHVGYAPGDAYCSYIPELKRMFLSKYVTFMEKLYRNPSTVAFDIGEESEDSDDESSPEDKVHGKWVTTQTMMRLLHMNLKIFLVIKRARNQLRLQPEEENLEGNRSRLNDTAKMHIRVLW